MIEISRVTLPLAVSACFVALATTIVLADDGLLPLFEQLPDAARPYPYVRCAGLYWATLEWAGEEQLGAQTYADANAQRESAILVASTLSASNPGASEQAILEHLQNTIRDARNVADIYAARFEANYARTGEAWANDLTVSSDQTLCKFVMEAASLMVNN